MSSISYPSVAGQQDASVEVVLGVDTHKDFHVAALVSVFGVLLACQRFPATAQGYRQMAAWAGGFGVLRRAGVEGSHSYGAGLTRHLQAAGLQVIEVSQPDRAERRRRGKTDVLDAEAAARAVLSGRAGAVAKTSTGPVEMIRMFKLAKASAVKARTQAINQLKAVLVGAEPSLRESLAGLSNPKLFQACAQLDAGTPVDAGTAAAYTLRLLALRITMLTAEITDLDRRITDAVNACTPALLDRRGVGPDTAAALLLAAGGNPHRLASEAGFAALCGVNPIEMSSGKTSRRRLNRGGDRQANSALYTVAVTRLRWDQRTREYVERRTTEGKTRREAIRCLKRYIARELYQLITQAITTPA
ncbi:IS110 family transposase [Actinoplanes bogorensis]|uniref:IS110 family transposase n=1 Tax=Paractinoplanes bogorensis TaxID=1610840 RepID=A0ABS5Z7Y6_9ACTN|nr:IS110 family transposase [Actinoplanes bogorensis]MBU2671059.1 IS110 family transposase [Actinoplanes bogorensis]